MKGFYKIMEYIEQLIHDYMEQEYLFHFRNFEIENVSIKDNIVSCDERCIVDDYNYDSPIDVSKTIPISVNLLDLLGFVYHKIPIINVR